MSCVAEHVEYLLRRHDCVALPGFGAFLCKYVGARFDECRSDSLLPPGRCLAFNQMIADADGLLVASVARKERISLDEALQIVRDEVDMLWQELEMSGEAAFGKLGTFYGHKDGNIEFDAAALPSINGTLYGLRALDLTPVAELVRGEADSNPAMEAAVADEQPVAIEEEIKPRVLRAPVDWRAYATGVVASLAVVLTAVLFVVSPIKLDREVHEAAIAPIPVSEAVEDYEQAEPFEIDGIMSALAEGVMIHDAVEAPEAEEDAVASVEPVKHEDGLPRFNDGDSYCVIVASFPSKAQAEVYLKENRGRQLGVLEKDSKFRIYAATGASYAAAEREREAVGVNDAWICRR